MINQIKKKQKNKIIPHKNKMILLIKPNINYMNLLKN